MIVEFPKLNKFNRSFPNFLFSSFWRKELCTYQSRLYKAHRMRALVFIIFKKQKVAGSLWPTLKCFFNLLISNISFHWQTYRFIFDFSLVHEVLCCLEHTAPEVNNFSQTPTELFDVFFIYSWLLKLFTPFFCQKVSKHDSCLTFKIKNLK